MVNEARKVSPEKGVNSNIEENQAVNIAAAKAIGEIVKSMLGPGGNDKMMVNNLGDAVVTNDGLKVMEELSIRHPATRLTARVAKSLGEGVGDGTKSAMVLAGELLGRGAELIKSEVHPTTVIKGYRLALDRCLEALSEMCTPLGEQGLSRVARTAMTGKLTHSSRKHYAEIVARAVGNRGREARREDFRFYTWAGEGLAELEALQKVVVEKANINSEKLRKKLEKVKVALLTGDVEIRKGSYRGKVIMGGKPQERAFLKREREILHGMVEKLLELDVGAVFCNKSINEQVAGLLAREGISVVVSRVDMEGLKNISLATGARAAFSPKTLTEAHLGKAESIEERERGGKRLLIVEGGPASQITSFLISGGSEGYVLELERCLKNGVAASVAALKNGGVVPGGGAVEAELAAELRRYYKAIQGREQLAVEAFAGALEVIPLTLARNSGLKHVALLMELRSAHSRGLKSYGIDAEGGLRDMLQAGVVDPYKMKKEMISSATQVASMVLRIEDNLPAEELNKERVNGLADE